MKTKKPFSSISYNTNDFLIDILNKWVKSGDVAFWCFIPHKGESGGIHPKDHKHVYIEPNKPIYTTDFVESTIELCDNEKPLKCVNCFSSKFNHWTWYTLHNPSYLFCHGGESRKYQYSKDDYISSDLMEFEDRFEMAMHDSTIINDNLIVKNVISGVSVGSLALDGILTMQNCVKARNYADIVNSGLREREYMEIQVALDEFRQTKLTEDNPFI